MTISINRKLIIFLLLFVSIQSWAFLPTPPDWFGEFLILRNTIVVKGVHIQVLKFSNFVGGHADRGEVQLGTLSGSGEFVDVPGLTGTWTPFQKSVNLVLGYDGKLGDKYEITQNHDFIQKASDGVKSALDVTLTQVDRATISKKFVLNSTSDLKGYDDELFYRLPEPYKLLRDQVATIVRIGEAPNSRKQKQATFGNINEKGEWIPIVGVSVDAPVNVDYETGKQISPSSNILKTYKQVSFHDPRLPLKEQYRYYIDLNTETNQFRKTFNAEQAVEWKNITERMQRLPIISKISQLRVIDRSTPGTCGDAFRRNLGPIW